MAGVIAAGLVTAGLGTYKAISGANQKAEANRLAKSNIFTPEELPYEVGLGTQLAQRNYTNGMPGEANALNNIKRNASSAFYRGQQGASSGGDILDLATRIGLGTNTATNQLAAQGEQYKANALGEYQNALNNEANWQKQLYNNNTLEPYLRTANLASSMYGAGQQNLYGGLDDIGSGIIGAATVYGKGSSQKSAWQNPTELSPALTASGVGVGSSPYPSTPIVPYQLPNTL